MIGVKILIGMEKLSFSIVLGIDVSVTLTSREGEEGGELLLSLLQSSAMTTVVPLFNAVAWQLPIVYLSFVNE
jgi:hypothetical protein